MNVISNPKVNIIGLTGGIGSGKSTVAARLRELGAFVIDADQVGRELMSEMGEAYPLVADAFKGDDIFSNEAHQNIDRSKLRALVFKDQAKRKRLEEIVHPLIRKHAKLKIDHFLAHGNGSETAPRPTSTNSNESIFVFYEAALLLETGADQDFDKVIIVIASREDQVKWASSRDHQKVSHIEAIINSQTSDEIRRKSGHILIENMGTKEELIQKVDKLYKELTKK